MLQLWDNFHPLWWRDESGHTVYDACGLYWRLKSALRPAEMNKLMAKRKRKRTICSMYRKSIEKRQQMASTPTE
ncbi:hypothetical protein GGTG_13500 [Gaeumannomyces tritici R3-111a-1]|uniref:GATA-type domain-containing protein n=1 Tax=Gaeumannomyces tritici (strain R3-111a-1) TaxID=644352 RepID=J3PJ18_GAET3|nr:hypothetical protein GGTG_13500 [Gaeumannomyces tritici R3-111a-1]EJT68907.1 hypothetical protein GGTG_13500 [Gaeumannomyces tritici R3-111a-1]